MTGEMLEWLKRHAWKACNRQKRFRGSNPRLSAGEKKDSKHDEAKASRVRIPVSPQGEKKDSKHDEAKASRVRIPVSPQENMWGEQTTLTNLKNYKQ